MKSPKNVFIEIYRENKWRDNSSLSGPGSNLMQTEAVRKALPLLIEELNCKSLLDIPCGDYFWMKLVETDVEYVGGDIVAELIENNQKQYGGNRRRFIHVDIIKDKLPRSDLVFCRDCLVHFSHSHAFRALKNIKDSGSKYLLTTTFIGRDCNKDILTGRWHPINLQLPPFNFPFPIRLINEDCPLDNYRDKNLGLWKVADIPDFEQKASIFANILLGRDNSV